MIEVGDKVTCTEENDESEIESVESTNKLEIIVDEKGIVRIFKEGKELKGITEVAFTSKVDEAPELYMKGFVV